MTANDSISIALLISCVSLICTLINTFAGGKKRQQEVLENENKRQLEIEKQFVTVNMKLDSFCETLNKMVMKSDKTNEELRKISEKELEHNIKIDDHEKRIINLEMKVK